MKNNYIGSFLIAFAIGLMIFFAGARACESYPFLAKWMGGECLFEDSAELMVDIAVDIADDTHIHEAEKLYLQAMAIRASDTDEEVLKAAIYALAQTGSAEAISALKEIVYTHPSPEIRKAALYALGQVDDVRVVRVLEEVATSPYPVELRKAAVYALQNADSEQAQASLYRILSKMSETL